MPNTTIRVARLSFDCESQAGRVSTARSSAAPRPHRAYRTSGIRTSSRGIGLTSRAACHVDTSPERVTVGFLVSSNATSTIRNRTASLKAGRLPGWNVIAWSMMPMPMAAIAIVGNRSMRPITAAASAWRRKLGPSTVPSGSPTVPARRNIATYANTLAMTHTTVWSRLTGMPSVAARSPRSADARIAVPNVEWRMNRPSAMKQTGTRMTVRRSVALKVTPGSV